MDLPALSVHGASQARILERAAITFLRDLPDPGIEPASPALAGKCFTTQLPGEPQGNPYLCVNYTGVTPRDVVGMGSRPPK